MRHRMLVVVSALALMALAFLIVVRPWYLRWGATKAEAEGSLPGDEIIPHAQGYTTRAITIEAPIDSVWLWLGQLGQDRGGFYSYDLLENAVGCNMPTEDRVLPEAKRTWRLGDKLWMYPKEKAGGLGFATLRTYVPGRALGFGTHATGASPTAREDGSWAMVLRPVGPRETRLVVRGRGAPGRSLLGVAFDRSIFEPVHFVMERRMMIGVEELAERGTRSRIQNHVQVVLWIVTFVFFVWALIMAIRSPRWQAPVLALLLSGAVFQVLTFAQPPIPLSLVLVVGLGLVLAWAVRSPGRRPNRSHLLAGQDAGR